MIRRFLIYFIGVLLGLMLVLFFFGDREYRFPYMPNERVLFHLQENPMYWSSQADCQWELLDGDSLLLAGFLWEGDVDFKNSNLRNAGIKTYLVKHAQRELWMVFEDKDTASVVLGIEGEALHPEDCQ